MATSRLRVIVSTPRSYQGRRQLATNRWKPWNSAAHTLKHNNVPRKSERREHNSFAVEANFVEMMTDFEALKSLCAKKAIVVRFGEKCCASHLFAKTEDFEGPASLFYAPSCICIWWPRAPFERDLKLLLTNYSLNNKRLMQNPSSKRRSDCVCAI